MDRLLRIIITSTALLVLLTGCRSAGSISVEAERIASPGFSLPTGLASDSLDHLYVFDSGTHRVVKFDRDGEFLGAWGGYGTREGEFNCYEDKGTICGIAVGEQDTIYVVDKGNYRIQKFDNEGTFLTSWGSQGSEDGQFIRPIYVAVDPHGNVFVTDDRNPVIQKFDRDGQFLLKWGRFGTGNGEFRHATGIAIDSDGYVYVSDYENRVIQKFDNEGRFIAAWETGAKGAAGVPEAIVIDANNRVYVTDSKLKQIEIFDINGETLETIGLKGAGLLNRISPYGITINSSGSLFVSDRQNDQVLKYSIP